MTTRWISIAAFILAMAVILGAFGAHGLKDRLDAYSLGVYEKAVFYHFIHGLGIFMVAVLAGSVTEQVRTNALEQVCLMLCFGIVIFSGSLYLLAVSGAKWLGAVTPIGGVLFIAGWVRLALASWKAST